VFFGHLDFFWKSSVQFICPFLHWVIDFGGSLIFCDHCILWILIPCQIYSWQWFSPILWAASWIWWPFLLLCRSFLVSFSPTCQSFLLAEKPFAFYLGSYCLCLLVLVYSLLFPALASKFQVLLRSLICFELILVQSERQGSSSIFLHADMQFSQQHLLKRLSFLHYIF
jgi:hypothetical protein